ncbi:MAG TPA: DUF1284 domain-containing protein [Armatimonadota bacterium]|nr:DUF1284 domain-containing protein [Armatimonadota bacterium]
MRARPHHLIDIITQYGAGQPFAPCDYGHAVHTVAARVIGDPQTLIEFVVGADDICDPCKHLVDGRCDDGVPALGPTASKQEYNDALDERLMQFLGITEGQTMTFREYISVLRDHWDGLVEQCAHPGESPAERAVMLERGLAKLEG